MDKKSK